MAEGKRIRTKVLVVDDHPANVTIVEEILDQEFELRSVTCGKDALASLEYFKPDIVLLDIMMPGIDGYEVCRRIRLDERFKFTKIVMLSAKARTQERLAGYQVGADDYLTKPFDHDELLWKMRVFSRLKAAEEVDAFKSRILDLLASDSGTPLQSIKAITEVLASPGKMSDSQRQGLGEVICRNGARICEFCDKMLRLVSIRSGSRNLALGRVDLGELVKAAVRRSLDKASLAKVRIDESYGEAVWAACDGGEIEKVVLDILDNAIRLSPGRGRVVVEVKGDGREGCIAIGDEGPGIPADRLPHLFEEPLSRGNPHDVDGVGVVAPVAQHRLLVDPARARRRAAAADDARTGQLERGLGLRVRGPAAGRQDRPGERRDPGTRHIHLRLNARESTN
jgi:two-component system sensor histidine kinase/response regulator